MAGLEYPHRSTAAFEHIMSSQKLLSLVSWRGGRQVRAVATPYSKGTSDGLSDFDHSSELDWPGLDLYCELILGSQNNDSCHIAALHDVCSTEGVCCIFEMLTSRVC